MRIFLTQTYGIQDCWYYNSGTISSTTVLTLPTISSPFELSFKNVRASKGNSWVEIGTDASNNIFTGQVSGSGAFGLYERINGSYAHNSTQGTFPTNSETQVVMTLSNNTLTSVKGSDTLTFSNISITGGTYCRVYLADGNSIKQLKIKPL